MKRWARYVMIIMTAALIATTGCGYSSSRLVRPGCETIAVPVFDNKTDCRGHEFELTRAVCKEIMQQTPYKLVSSPEEADLVVLGEISDYLTPVAVEDKDDQTVESLLSMRLRIDIKDNKKGETIALVKSSMGAREPDIVSNAIELYFGKHKIRIEILESSEYGNNVSIFESISR